MKKALLFILFALNINAQTKDEDIKIRIVKAKLVDNVSVFGMRDLKVKNDELKKVMVKAKILSTPDNRAKLSGFSLIDNVNKIRYRLADYKGYLGVIDVAEFIPYTKFELFNEKGKKMDWEGLPEYNPAVKDYFDQFDKEGYTNVEIPVNFGTKEKPNLSIIYFGETEHEDFTAELFFVVFEKYKDLDYELYYMDKKISDIKFNNQKEKSAKAKKQSDNSDYNDE
ncbi:hypothetical protein [Flavobacterium sangjuense]|uniref:Uncharacterized protein n=1 Tax=Flavobacterium sangjuense TaxID=2518177 RepID=A0A4P7PWE0_9FLAO|nr:hypothetical protein [Flavobacterium sangjuense]QBZ98273.1 hypothetical protein GS03_01778 [Flavobacterium sangjuense]